MRGLNQFAFPQWDGHAITGEPMYLRGGMSLRDYFAAAALQGLLAGNPEAPEIARKAPESTAAIVAYNFADAMLEAREKKT